MKSRTLTLIIAVTLLAALAMPIRIVAQAKQLQAGQPQHYIITDLGTLKGATFSQPFSINNIVGLVSGSGTLPDGTMHAVLWLQGLEADIGAPGLGGPNSIAFGDNNKFQAVGEAETSALDTNGEDFCGFGTHLTCRPFLWEQGVMSPLPTLGGNNGVANMINYLGEVAGFAETGTPDATCPAPQAVHFSPVVWENGVIRQLPTFEADPDGAALGINGSGQVVGASGTCAAFNPNTGLNLLPSHALLWDYKGKVTDLGNLGGKTGQAGGNLAFDLNNRGQVVGISDLSGDTTFHAFLWTKAKGMQDLGTLSGDVGSVGVAINDAGEVVGESLDASGNPRAFLWQNSEMTDLNTLIPADSPLYLLLACGINSRGQIVGLAATAAGELHTYLATPGPSEAGNEVGSETAKPGSPGVTDSSVLSDDARDALQQRVRFGQFGTRPTRPR